MIFRHNYNPENLDLTRDAGTETTQTLMNDEANYVCDACGEEIVIPIDPTQGMRLCPGGISENSPMF